MARVPEDLERFPAPEGERAGATPLPRPTSFAQRRLWVLDQLDPGNPAYNDQVVLAFDGPLDVRALEASLSEIERRHETLRTTFSTAEGEPIQLVWPPAPFRLEVLILKELSEESREAQLWRLAEGEADRPFDLARGPLQRSVLLRADDRRHVLVLTMHHIVTDGWSKEVFLRELGALYEAFSSGRPSPLPELPIQYGDFARWQREWLRGEVLESLVSYWKGQLGKDLPVVNLAGDRARHGLRSFRGGRQTSRVPRELTAALKALSLDEGATLYMTLLAAFQTLIFRLTGDEDVLVGTDIANRSHVETEALIGVFVNLLVLRTDLGGNPRFRELLGRVRTVALDAYAHQDLPFDQLVHELRPDRDLSRNPLVQVLFVMHNLPSAEASFPGLRVAALDPKTDIARFDLAIFITESEGRLLVKWVYSTDLFEASMVASLSGRFERLLGSIVEDPDTRLRSLEILSEAEKHRLRDAENERLGAQSARLRSKRRRAIDLSSSAEVRVGLGGDGRDD